MMDLFQLGIALLSLLFVLTIHEVSHALVAYYLGDPTAKLKGRLTLNPIPHLDLMGTLILLVTWKIGWAKPVPINPGNFKNPVRDTALTALAGPISNFLFAFVVAIPLKYAGEALPETVFLILWTLLHTNIYIGLFNLLPLPPLDGSKVLGLLIPKRFIPKYEMYLEEGVKYFVALILIDAFIMEDLVGHTIFLEKITLLHDWVFAVLLLGT